jgi:hypothetical protein
MNNRTYDGGYNGDPRETLYVPEKRDYRGY